jgi:oxygen-dependent protoporphyrinogen oxidase
VRIVVIGGGISGLTAAYLADAAGHDVVCVDPAVEPGGLIRTERTAGFFCELGPQAVLDDAPDTLALIDRLGLGDRRVEASVEAGRRFVYLRGALRVLPSGPAQLATSGVLSPMGKLRLLREPFVPPLVADGVDGDRETVTAFGLRRLGREATRLLETAVIGLYAGAGAELSLASALPRLAAMEREHGGLFRAMRALRGQGRRPARPLSFREGLGELAGALARALGPRRIVARALAIEPHPAPAPAQRWRVRLARTGGVPPGDVPAEVDGDDVIVAADRDAAADLLAPLAPDAAAGLRGIATAPIALVCLGWRDAAARPIGVDLRSYGFLVARGENIHLLGCQYETSIFPGRGPESGVLLRAILGGTGGGFEPDIVGEPDERIVARALEDLHAVAGLRRDRAPDMVKVWRPRTGIPQPRPGHRRRVAEIDAALARHGGLHLLGHAVRGVGVNEGIKAATALVARLGPPGNA